MMMETKKRNQKNKPKVHWGVSEASEAVNCERSEQEGEAK